MNHSTDNSDHSNREISDEQLDRLLAGASLPSMDHNRRRRLENDLTHQLRRVSSQRVSGAIAPMGLSRNLWIAGTMVACGLFVAILMFRPPPTPPALASSETTENETTENSPPEFDRSEPTHEIITHVMWYPPADAQSRPITTAIENQLTTLLGMLNDFANSKSGLTLLQHATLALDLQMDEAVRTRNGAANRRLQPLQELRRSFELKWVGTIESDRTSIKQKTTAFRALCRCGSVQSLDVLLGYWSSTELQPDIAIAAIRLANSATLGRMVDSTANLEIKTDLMMALLQRGDQTSVNEFLELTHRNQLFSIARHCGERARPTPRALLISSLRSNRMGIVQAAAITLSNIDDPLITEYLLALAQAPETTHAAMLALTARQDDRSTRFVEFASADQRWAGVVSMARKKWNRLSAIN